MVSRKKNKLDNSLYKTKRNLSGHLILQKRLVFINLKNITKNGIAINKTCKILFFFSYIFKTKAVATIQLAAFN